MSAAAPARQTAVETTAELTESIARDGYCVLRGLLPLDLVERWHDAFMPLYAAATGRPDVPSNRGPGRHYLDLPFAAPFSDPAVYEHPAILALVEAVLGPDPLLLILGTDTPAAGSEDQGVHSDLIELFPDAGVVPPTYALAVNVPLVDVTRANGPFEAAAGSHRLLQQEAQARVASGESPLCPILLERGDVLVRDMRMLHRGTANPGPPRPVAVLCYHRPWYRHHGFGPIGICPSLRQTLSERARRLLRLHLEHERFA
jgi:hypothetical protein